MASLQNCLPPPTASNSSRMQCSHFLTTELSAQWSLKAHRNWALLHRKSWPRISLFLNFLEQTASSITAFEQSLQTNGRVFFFPRTPVIFQRETRSSWLCLLDTVVLIMWLIQPGIKCAHPSWARGLKSPQDCSGKVVKFGCWRLEQNMFKGAKTRCALETL